MNCLLVPTLALDISLLDRLNKSIDHHIPQKILVNNGHYSALDKWEKENPDWIVLHTDRNLGVSASWNLAPTQFYHNSWLIVNDDQEFQPGCLKKICQSMNENPHAHIHYVNEYQAYDIFGWTRRAVEDFGLFDENFYPGYFEDWEMRLRLKLGKAQINVMQGITVKHGKPKPAGKRYMDMLAKFKPVNEDYFIRKWGKISDSETDYTAPFNDKTKTIKYWILEEGRRKMMEDVWDEFMKQPALYD